MLTRLLPAMLALWLVSAAGWAQDSPVVIASKFGAEPLILSEMMAQLLEANGVPVERKLSLGPTEICFPAMRSKQVDVYVEYTGAGLEQILHESVASHDPLETFLYVQRRFNDEYEMVWMPPFGFDNTYALAIPEKLSRERNLTKLSQLGLHSDLRAGFDFQFLNAPDQFPALAKFYGLSFKECSATEHSLAYQAIAQGKIEVVEAYSTDAELKRLNLVPLEDDRHFFPLYQAAPLVRKDTLRRYPYFTRFLAPLAFSISAQKMQELNLKVLQGASPAQVAADFLRTQSQAAPKLKATKGARLELGPLVLQHLGLTLGAVTLATLVGLPLGIYVFSRPRLAQLALGVAGVIQTIPGIALLAFFIAVPGLGLGLRSALAALFLYGLLPILRNTVTGLQQVDPLLKEAALGLGMRPSQVLWWVELPLALPTIMAGLRTCAVITVGSATLAAFIGAGGLGVPIVTGLQLNDPRLILSGAIPSALLAVMVDVTLGWLEGRLSRVPAG